MATLVAGAAARLRAEASLELVQRRESPEATAAPPEPRCPVACARSDDLIETGRLYELSRQHRALLDCEDAFGQLLVAGVSEADARTLINGAVIQKAAVARNLAKKEAQMIRLTAKTVKVTLVLDPAELLALCVPPGAPPMEFTPHSPDGTAFCGEIVQIIV
jgi:hypothetical protein